MAQRLQTDASMTLHAFVPSSTGKLWGLVFDDDRDLANVFFHDDYGLGGLKADLGTDVPDVNVPSDVSEHMAYHGLLADALFSAGAPEELVSMVRSADPRHGHMQFPTGRDGRESAGGIMMMKKWIDKNTARSFFRVI